MNRRQSRSANLGFLGAILTGVCLISPARAADPSAGATNAPGPVLLWPANRSAVAGTVQLIVVNPKDAGPPAVRLDGQPVKLESLNFAPTWLSKPPRSAAAKKLTQAAASPLLRHRQDKTLWTTVASLTPGEHTLELGDAKIRLLGLSPASATNAPAGWSLWHAHPSPTKPEEPIACASCHEVKDAPAGSVIGRAKPPQSCFPCHNAVDLRLAHSHVLDPLSNCLMCHDPHGSTRPKLLIESRETLCTQCHEAGHSTN